jgi:hypothetical protein
MIRTLHPTDASAARVRRTSDIGGNGAGNVFNAELTSMMLTDSEEARIALFNHSNTNGPEISDEAVHNVRNTTASTTGVVMAANGAAT